jgi:hypothetical protein
MSIRFLRMLILRRLIRVRNRDPEDAKLLRVRGVPPRVRLREGIREGVTLLEDVRLVADLELDRARQHVDELHLARQGVELVARSGAGSDDGLDSWKRSSSRDESRWFSVGKYVSTGERSCLRTSAGAGSRSKMWLRRTPSASQMRAIEDRDGAVRSRSSWLMKPLVSPVAAASCSIVSPRSRRSDRTRAPTFGVSFRAASGVALGTCGSYAGLVERQLRPEEYRYSFCS